MDKIWQMTHEYLPNFVNQPAGKGTRVRLTARRSKALSQKNTGEPGRTYRSYTSRRAVHKVQATRREIAIMTKLAQGRGGSSEAGQRQRGFSLIELLIVVAIILIIAAIAIPNLLRARIAANESSAVASIRTLNTAQISYNSAYPTVGFAAGLTNLAGTSCAPPTSAGACLVDTQLASGSKSGYKFTMGGVTGTPAATYQAIATPLTPNQTGTRYFCSFADAVVRTSAALIATCDYSVSPLQ